MEARTVLSPLAPAPPPTHGPADVGASANANVSVSVPITITGINLTKVVTDANGIVTSVTGTVTGLLAGHQFTAPITLSANPPATPGSCSVLDLDLGPINLNLLGLQVTTSPICLDITGTMGPGNLLGNLVCDLAGALNGSTATGLLGSLEGLLGSLGSQGTGGILGDLNSLLTTVESGAAGTGSSSILGLLNGALGSGFSQLGSPTVSGSTSTPTGNGPGSDTDCNILNLSVGPLNLNLLGLNVALNNCANPPGPITVTITAIPGPGNLLGNLLCDVAHLLDVPGNPLGAIEADLNQIISIIEHLP